MAVDTKLVSLFEKLKADDPYLPPRTWELIPSQSGPVPPTSASASHFPSSAVSETSLVRLALNALQGVRSSIISVQKLSHAFCSAAADRTSHQNPSLWNLSVSTDALGKVLKSMGALGSLVFLLHRFVEHFTNFNSDGRMVAKMGGRSELEENQNFSKTEGIGVLHGLVNQAFAIAVRKVLDGYIMGLHTLPSSVMLRRWAKNAHLLSDDKQGCLSDVGCTKLTLLEVFLHTEELRTQIETLGNICNLNDINFDFYDSLDHLQVKAIYYFQSFFRGGELLSHLYTQLKIADPAHLVLLKFLFLRSCEPYCEYIRSWIFRAEINDPYKEFIVEYASCNQPHSHVGLSSSQLTSVWVRDQAVIPCFLKGFLAPLLRAGQQLQVLMKLLEKCIYSADRSLIYEDLLPFWSAYSKDGPLTFSKDDIEAMVQRREKYYKIMLGKLENLPKKFELCSQEVEIGYFSSDSQPLDEKPKDIPTLLTFDDDLITLPTPENCENRSLSDTSVGKGDEDCFSEMDAFDSSECSSVLNTELDIQLPDSPCRYNERHLTTLKFFNVPHHAVNSQERLLKCDKAYHRDIGISDSFCDTNRHCLFMERGCDTSGILMDAELTDLRCSYMDVKCLPCNPWPLGGLQRNPFSINEMLTSEVTSLLSSVEPQMKVSAGSLENQMKCLVENPKGGNSSENISSYHYAGNKLIPNLSSVKAGTFIYTSNFLSRNPVLRKPNIFNITNVPDKGRSFKRENCFPCFRFSAIEGHSICAGELAPNLSDDMFANLHSYMRGPVGDQHGKLDLGAKIVNEDCKTRVNDIQQPCLECEDNENQSNPTGGSAWESLLCGFNLPSTSGSGVQEQNLLNKFEIPVDSVVEKCLVQEILIQYKFVSKLTINLLEQEFGLQEHLLALRRYHFMEFADWADLFIMSLWNHRWVAVDVDQRVAEIQGLLKLSIQRSSCEYDFHKDRLYVYIKGHGTTPLSSSTMGIHSFDFLGLGYQVHWPVSLILTPGALKIYADIHSFLIQVKIALFSLTDRWYFFKELMNLIYKARLNDAYKQKVSQYNILMKLRCEINHFVSTLQQYVQSGLAHVSWSRFLDSLKHKVNDMMDLQSVHMDYLTESLHICFLSDEMQSISAIIESILQCALEFRFCFKGAVIAEGAEQEDLLEKLSAVDLSKVQAIKSKFYQSMKDLHLLYLKSSKNREFGFFRFWNELNYNGYYSELFKEPNGHAFMM